MIRLFICVLLVLGIVITGPASAREVVPAPPPGEETSILAADHAVPFTGKTLSPDYDRILPETGDIPAQLKAAMGDKMLWDDLGGDDITIALGEDMGFCSLDIASNGDIYAAVGYSFVSYGRIEVYRSRNRGSTWYLWGEFIGTDHTDMVAHPDLIIAEGVVDRCFLAFRSGQAFDWDIVVAHSPLSSNSGDWTEIVAMPGGSSSYQRPKLATDASNYSDYFLYLVAEGDDGIGGDIWFGRSMDQGNTYETPYQIGTISISDRKYAKPEISYGMGGHIHVAWYLTSDVDAVESAVRYRRARYWGNLGLGSWGDIKMITGLDAIHDHTPLIAASEDSPEVVMTYGRVSYYSGEDVIERPRVLHSTDDGTTFGIHTTIPEGMYSRRTLEQNPADGTWVMSGTWNNQAAIQRASAADPLTWSDAEAFVDDYYLGGISSAKPMALDPSDGYRPAMVWTCTNPSGPGGFYFDADWRRDPGYPNLEGGFPVELSAPPISHPAVVDVTGNGRLEIVFSDAANRIQVIKHDGSSAPGWPQDVGVTLSDGPVAVGDLNGDGHPVLVVGGTNGRAHAYDHQGNPLPGWPSVIMPPGTHIFVSIGAVGPPYPRSVICAGGDMIILRSHHGLAPPDTYGRAFPGNTFEYPAVVGDIDDDGAAEIVGGLGTKVFAYQKGVPGLEISINLPSALSDALTMGDLDLDGDLEILCPTVSGELYALDHTGSLLGGNFPYDVGASTPITSAAIAQFRGTQEPDIAFGHFEYRLQALYHDGEVIPGFPQFTSILCAVYAAPIIGGIDGTAGDLAIADWLGMAWGFANSGEVIEGWPRNLYGPVTESLAMGDIDLDTSNEMVMLTETQLLVVDLNNSSVQGEFTWPMYGHDPARTGCADCPENLVTPVDPGVLEGGVTRVSFAGASPNPISGGGTQFSFAVPQRSAVSLEILDLRGARVYTVYREETEAGPQVVTWNGCDGAGRPVASGPYFARLRVRGPGLNEELTRKLMIVK